MWLTESCVLQLRGKVKIETLPILDTPSIELSSSEIMTIFTCFLDSFASSHRRQKLRIKGKPQNFLRIILTTESEFSDEIIHFKYFIAQDFYSKSQCDSSVSILSNYIFYKH